MKKDKEKVKYESPQTRRTQVELENGFMSASIVDKDDNTDNSVTAGHQEIEDKFDFTNEDPWSQN